MGDLNCHSPQVEKQYNMFYNHIFQRKISMHHFENGDAHLSACSLSFQAKFVPNGFCFDQAITSSIQFIFILKVYVKYHKICLTEN